MLKTYKFAWGRLRFGAMKFKATTLWDLNVYRWGVGLDVWKFHLWAYVL